MQCAIRQSWKLSLIHIFASVAKKQGFEQIAALFLKTADNEKEHAKLWFKELNGIGDTADNLKTAAAGENYEDVYKRQIAGRVTGIAGIAITSFSSAAVVFAGQNLGAGDVYKRQG